MVRRIFSDRGSGPELSTYSKKTMRALGCWAKRWMKSAGLAGGEGSLDSSSVGVHSLISSAVVSSGLLVTSILPYFFRASTALGELRFDK